jgi:septum formation protein
VNPLLPEAVQADMILASKSPRRIDILRSLAFEFDVVPPHDHVEESAQCEDAHERAVVRARLKAEDVASKHPDSLVIGADTVVIVDGESLEKPVDDGEAARFLETLSGREHIVVTAIAVRKNSAGVDLSGSESTRVFFRELSAEEISRYVASGEGRDKAGSYAIQGIGAALVRSIDGCFFNVVGLPVTCLFDLLRKVPAKT